MRRRIVSIALALLMVMLPISLAACGRSSGTSGTSTGETNSDGSNTNTSKGTKKTRTITIYCPTGDETTEAGIKAAEEAINQYTEGTYLTRIVLKLYPENEYYDVLKSKLEQHQTNVDNGISSKQDPNEENKDNSDENQSDDKYTSTVKFPDLVDPQVDIFVLNGKDRLEDYAKMCGSSSYSGDTGYLMPIGSYLEVNYKLIKKYITSSFLSSGMIGDSQVGIPNNHVMGEYTYLLLNKEIVDSLYFSPEEIAGSADKLLEYLSDARKYYGSYIPMYNYPTDRSVQFTDEFSFLGGMVTDGMYEKTQLLPSDLLANAEYVAYLKCLNTLKNGGYVTEGDEYSLPEGKQVAAGYIKGGYGAASKYSEDYYVMTVNEPFATSEEYPGSFLCVSPYTADVDRCVEIIEALTTDSKLRNLFQYGKEGVHYSVNYDGVYKLIKNADTRYDMDPMNTGNEFIMAQNSDMDENMLSLSADDWKGAKQQAAELMRSPYSLFTLTEITAENYWKKSMYWTNTNTAEFNELAGIDPDVLSKEDIKELQDAAREKDPFFEYPCYYTKDIIDNVCAYSKELYNDILNYTGNNFEGYVESIREQFESYSYYKAFIADETGDLPAREDYNSDAAYQAALREGPNADSPYAQYKIFYETSAGLR